MQDDGMPVDNSDKYGNTALMQAARNGCLDVARWLILKGACVNKRGDRDWTAIHHAAYSNSNDVIRVLLQCGATTSIESENGSIPIDVVRRWVDEEAVRLLKQH